MQHVYADKASASTGSTKDEAPAGATGRSFEDQHQDASPDCRGADGVGQSAKEFAALRARLALSGYALHITLNSAGSVEYLVTRWDCCPVLPDVTAVRAFAGQIGARIHA